MKLELSREYLERLEAAIEAQDSAFVTSSMEEVHPADISEVLYQLNTPQCKFVLDQLAADVTAEILSNLDSDTRRRFIQEVYESSEIARLIPHMDSDDAADLLDEQPVRFREEVIALIESPQVANDIIELLHYDEDCAGGLMAKELIKANINWTIAETIDEIRRQAENVEKIFSIYVVDDFDRLLGKVSTKKILLSQANTRVADIFDENVIKVESYLEMSEVADQMRRYDLEAIPVVNIQGKLLGRITIDDIIDVITEQAETDQQIMSGISANTEADDNVLKAARARLPWLLIGMGGGLLGAQFMGLFEEDLRIIPAMAFFIPLITATGGNVGIQSSTIVVQSISNRTYLGDNLMQQFLKVLLIALINGAVISSIVGSSILLFGHPRPLALTVGAALMSVVMLASIMGTITPLVLDRFGVNPALASGPFITTANDLLGLAVYFTVAHLLYAL